MNYSKSNKTVNTLLRRILKSRIALSTVVTTLIILVISVLLASVVTYFAINVVSTRVQEESLALTKQHVWYSAGETSKTQAALMIINTGGRDVVIQKFSIRGQTVQWTDVYYSTTNAAVSDDLPCHTDITAETTKIGTTDITFVNAKDSLTLQSGYSMLLYINKPDSITINDLGLTVSITLNTAQAMYYVEANVQAYVPSAEGVVAKQDANVDFVSKRAWYSENPAFSQGAFVITNNEADEITITGISLNDAAGSDVYAVVGNWDGLEEAAVSVQTGDLSKYEPVAEHPLESVDVDKDGIVITAGDTAVVYFTAGDLSDKLGDTATLSLTITGFNAKIATALVWSSGITADATIVEAYGWYSENPAFSQGAFVITNTGDKPITINQIYLACAFPTIIYYYSSNALNDFNEPLEWYEHPDDFSPVDGHPLAAKGNGDALRIPVGETAVIYFDAFGMDASAIGHSVAFELRCAGFDAYLSTGVIIGEANLG